MLLQNISAKFVDFTLKNHLHSRSSEAQIKPANTRKK